MVKRLPMPISHIVVEDVQVDVARLNNPDLRGSQYQDPTRLDENLRMACLMRDGYRCQLCGERNCCLQVHHLVFRAHGGKDTLSNLLTLCQSCHTKLHQGKLTLPVTGVSGYPDVVAQRTMQGKAYLYAALGKRARLSTVFGYETSTLRKARGMDKTHDEDALCIATFQTGAVVPFGRKNFYRIAFRPRQTRRQYHDKPRRGLGRVRYQVREELKGFRKGDIVLVKGNWVKQITAIYGDGRLAFRRVKGQPPAAYPKDCQLLERERTIVYEKVV